MKLWQNLYGMIWLVFLQIILIVVLSSLPASLFVYVITLHSILGLVIFGLAFYDNSMMQKLEVPFRLKGIVKSTFTLAGAQLVLGIILYTISNIYTLGDIGNGVVLFIHVGIALAIITQASSAATAYDMWEEKEYNPPYTDPKLKSSKPA